MTPRRVAAALPPPGADAPPDAAAPVRLRPHHLLCVLGYVGKGYSPAFTAGFDAVVARLSQGATVQVVDGPDDICAPLQHDATAHCRNDSVRRRDERAARDLGALMQQRIAAGAWLSLDATWLHTWRTAFAQGHTRSACQGCEWHALCSTVAAHGFEAARLQEVRETRPPDEAC